MSEDVERILLIEGRLLDALNVLADVAHDPISRNWLDAQKIIDIPANQLLVQKAKDLRIAGDPNAH